MPRFVQAGNHWINLELVTSIEFVEAPKDPDRLIAVRVHYTTGKSQDFRESEQIDAIRTFLVKGKGR